MGLGLDAVQTDGLLALLDGTVVLALAQLAALLVAHHIEGDHVRVVVLIAFLLLQIAVDERLLSVEVDVITRRECVIHTVRRGVLLHVAGGEKKKGEKERRNKERRSLPASHLSSIFFSLLLPSFFYIFQ